VRGVAIAALVIGLFLAVLFLVAVLEGRLVLFAPHCAICDGSGTIPCPSCTDGTQVFDGTGETRPCPVCKGTMRVRCPGCAPTDE